MSMQKWAEREVEIACERERANSETPSDEFDYGCACYKSALKAYKSLMEDEHSGFSFNITKNILNRLLDEKPLTPIEDTDDAWVDNARFYSESETGHTACQCKTYQCKRMSSLFKYVYADGTIKYKDISNNYSIDINNPKSVYGSGLAQKLVDEMFPITMPYYPGKPIKVYCEDFLNDPKNGDFDTVGIFYLLKPNGERVEINRFFKAKKNGWDEIDEDEYLSRKKVVKEEE